MSTKIHHGYRLDSDINIFEFQALLNERLNPVRDRLDLEMFTKLAVHSIDLEMFGLLKETDFKVGRTPLLSVWLNWRDRQRKMTATQQDSHFEDYDPHRLEFYVGQDPESHLLYGLLFTESEDLKCEFRKIPGVHQYPYWNHVDAPDDIDENEWSHRQEVWERVLGWDAPVSRMWSLRLRPESDVNPEIFRGENAAPVGADFTPSTASRAKELCTRAVSRLTDSSGLAADWLNAARTQLFNAAGLLNEIAASMVEEVEPLLWDIKIENLHDGLPSEVAGTNKELSTKLKQIADARRETLEVGVRALTSA